MAERLAEDARYAERAASWRPVGAVVGLCLLGFIVDLALPGHHAHTLGWALALLAIGGVVAIAAFARMQFGSVTVTDTRLRVGRETIPLSTVDISYFEDDEAGGPPVGARILGGGMAVPKGRSAMPVRLVDGTVIVVPCRHPDRLRDSLLEARRDR
ncbi:MAG TPA: DUF3093 family protein [Mycobacteriales bacterium]|jgi:hypothetical protein|nr:DUF3093 family protein [Mycobacteriales bacterium]